jgi:hypothetical protein
MFPGKTESEMLKLMQEIRGLMPKKLRVNGRYAAAYYDNNIFRYQRYNEKLRQMTRETLGIHEICKTRSILDMLPSQTEEDRVLA